VSNSIDLTFSAARAADGRQRTERAKERSERRDRNGEVVEVEPRFWGPTSAGEDANAVAADSEARVKSAIRGLRAESDSLAMEGLETAAGGGGLKLAGLGGKWLAAFVAKLLGGGGLKFAFLGTSMSSKQAIRALEKAGWKFERSTGGSHHQFKHPDGRSLAVPHPKHDLSPGLVNQIRKALGPKPH
jgi:predicted RNA binding protein YcfA (HicA-like mRNA interferase family)